MYIHTCYQLQELTNNEVPNYINLSRACILPQQLCWKEWLLRFLDCNITITIVVHVIDIGVASAFLDVPHATNLLVDYNIHTKKA